MEPISLGSAPETAERGLEGVGDEVRKGKLSYSKKQVEKLIAEAVQSSKEIDQRTIKEMIKEIDELNSTVKLQEQRFQQEQQRIDSTPPLPVPTPSPPHLLNQQKDSQHDVSIQIVYSFLLGSFVMLFVSTLFPWMISHAPYFLSHFWNLGRAHTSSTDEVPEG